ncbi:MAG TPA: phosphoribosyltransferase family protein [Jatrophihabitans sp.]|jgi:putative phosphoribosyl transferase|nr:phosphoribosyltransferase family protein [Jatrophihabitans sp.]
MREPFADRNAAGDALGARVAQLALRRPLVLGLPRGGVVVAARIAERLGAPLDVVIVRKIGCPGHRELAMGALAVWGPHSAVVRNEHVIATAGVSEAKFERAREREAVEAQRRVAEWGQPVPDVSDTDVVLVDDGLATGATMHAALEVAGRAGAKRLICAVPVGAPVELSELADQVDELVYLDAPHQFHAVGLHYRDFREVDDATVAEALAAARARVG